MLAPTAPVGFATFTARTFVVAPDVLTATPQDRLPVIPVTVLIFAPGDVEYDYVIHWGDGHGKPRHTMIDTADYDTGAVRVWMRDEQIERMYGCIFGEKEG